MRRIVLAPAIALLFAVAACGDNSPADPCIAMGCPLPPAPHCTDGSTLVVTVPSSCSDSGGTPDCQYTDETVNCAVTGQECGAGACHPPGDPCLSATCDAPPANACKDSDTLTTYDATGVCDGSSGNAICAYAPHDTDCTATDQVCHDGACVDLCAGTTCDEPPDAACDEGGVLTTYASPGTCDASSGTPTCTYDMSTEDCRAANEQCNAGAGACIDPCATNPCTTAPADSCTDGTHSLHHTSPGACTSPNGVVACDYTATTTIDCGALNQICDDATGACADPCAINPCTSPDPDTCIDSSHSSHHPNPGVCTSPGGVVACDYTPTPVDCAANDQTCDDATGACTDPCIGFTCDEPPPNTCSDATHAVTHGAGVCTAPGGVPQCDYPPSTVDCGGNDQACVEGACVDPCAGITCDTPPAASCTGLDSASTFSNPGTCVSPGGVQSCQYTQADTDCELTGKTCTDGACGGPAMFCRVQSPSSVTDIAGATPTIFSHVFVTGVTDRTPDANDPDATVVVQLGTGTGTDPLTYTWANAAPNPAYGSGSPGFETNNDEYQATLTVAGNPGATTHYAYRLSGDSGATWLYCDAGNAGSSDGFGAPADVHVEGLYFSEYIEGSSNNKAVEIYNPSTTTAFSLAGCQIQVFSNGSTTGNAAVALTSTSSIAAQGTYVYCNTSYTAAVTGGQCQQTSGGANWNGNDAVVLSCGGVVFDSFGQVGNDPGATGWGAVTTDHTLLRDCNVSTGDAVDNDAFDPTVQWGVYAKDMDFLGARNCPLP